MRLSPAKLTATITIALLSAIAVALLLQPKCILPLRILATAQSANATVQSSRTTVRFDEEVVYDVSYTFQVAGREWRGRSRIPWQPTTEMTAWYLPADPSVNGLQLNNDAALDLAIFLIPSGLLLLCLVALAMHNLDPSNRATIRMERTPDGE